jgi:hypothetical protein
MCHHFHQRSCLHPLNGDRANRSNSCCARSTSSRSESRRQSTCWVNRCSCGRVTPKADGGRSPRHRPHNATGSQGIPIWRPHGRRSERQEERPTGFQRVTAPAITHGLSSGYHRARRSGRVWSSHDLVDRTDREVECNRLRPVIHPCGKSQMKRMSNLNACRIQTSFEDEDISNCGAITSRWDPMRALDLPRRSRKWSLHRGCQRLSPQHRQRFCRGFPHRRPPRISLFQFNADVFNGLRCV